MPRFFFVFFFGPLRNLNSHSVFFLPPSLSCLLFHWKGSDVAQIAVAHRNRLSSPPFINKVPPALPRLSAATEEQQARVRLSTNCLSVSLAFFFKLQFLLSWTLPPSLSGAGPLTLCSVSEAVCACVSSGKTSFSTCSRSFSERWTSLFSLFFPAG